MKFLVTGGAGFIGSNIVDRLVSDGHSVVVLDNFSSGKEENLSEAKAAASGKNNPSCPLCEDERDLDKYCMSDKDSRAGSLAVIRGDITDYGTCLDASAGVDAVLHQAALRSVPKSFDNPYEYNRVNIDGILNLLRACLENKVKRFVFASSSSVYGETKTFPEKESFPTPLISPYALSKLAGEHYCNIYNKVYGLETVALRYFNVFGKRQSLDDQYAVVIPKFIDCIMKGQNPPVHGTGKQSRDFTYVSNVVDANLLAAAAKGAGGQVFNIACGESYSLLDLIKIINKLLGKTTKPVFEPKRKGDVFKTLADISKAKRILRYKPGVSFEEGLRLTVDWFKKKN